MHALATSEHATTLPGDKGGKGGGAKGGVGESWALADDPHALWCTAGTMLAPDSP